jgi:hypothetical protein
MKRAETKNRKKIRPRDKQSVSRTIPAAQSPKGLDPEPVLFGLGRNPLPGPSAGTPYGAVPFTGPLAHPWMPGNPLPGGTPAGPPASPAQNGSRWGRFFSGSRGTRRWWWLPIAWYGFRLFF